MRASEITTNDQETSSMEDESGHQDYDDSMGFDDTFPIITNSSTEEEEEDMENDMDDDNEDECDDDFVGLGGYPEEEGEEEEEEEEEEDEEVDREEDYDESQDSFWQELDLDHQFLGTRSRSPPSALARAFFRSRTPNRGFEFFGSKRPNFRSINNSLSQTIRQSSETTSDPHAFNSLSYLMPGRSFVGTQIQVLDFKNSDSQDRDRWEVKVTIHSIDLKSGLVVGLMEALNVPVASSTVITYWEGEIVDFTNYDLWTRKWGASENVDTDHWKRFAAFKNLQAAYLLVFLSSDEKSYLKIYKQYIFMRWKEKFFVNILPHESGLTIAGFYYICIRRSDGFIEGFYYDPTSKPFQRLALNPTLDGSGHSFSEYSFA